MKVILDTNVVVSAILLGRVPAEVLLFVVDSPEIDWIASQDILEEYREVLARPKFSLPKEIPSRWMDTIDSSVTVYEVSKAIEFPRDPKDAKFLACALESEADFLVTGDHDFEEAQRLGRTMILSVSQFKALVCDQISKPE